MPRFPPLLAFLVAGLLIWSLNRAVPSLSMAVPAAGIIAGPLALVAGIVAVLAILIFRRARTTIDPREPDNASVLVTTGVFRYSRNPMYLSLVLLLIAWTVRLGAWHGVLVVAAFVAYLDRFQIRAEERALESTFGEAYLEYKRCVRRWL